MKRIIMCLCAAVLVTVGLSSCGGGGDSAQVDEFVKYCMESGGDVTEENCRCAGDALAEKLTPEQYATINEVMAMAGEVETDPSKAEELMAKMMAMGEDVMQALDEVGRACE